MVQIIKFLPYAGWPLAILFYFLWQGVQEDLADEINACEMAKMAMVAEASEAARKAQGAAFAKQIRELRLLAQDAEDALKIAEDARLAAEARPPEVREVIRRVADANACLNTDMPVELVDSLR